MCPGHHGRVVLQQLSSLVEWYRRKGTRGWDTGKHTYNAGLKPKSLFGQGGGLIERTTRDF